MQQLQKAQTTVQPNFEFFDFTDGGQNESLRKTETLNQKAKAGNSLLIPDDFKMDTPSQEPKKQEDDPFSAFNEPLFDSKLEK